METLRTSIVAPTATPASHLQNKTDAKAKESIAKIQPPLFYQPKLTIGAPDDVYEKEADAMADKVMRMPMPEPINFSTAMNVVNRKCTECKEEEKLQRKEKRDEDDDKIQMKSENTIYTGKAAPSIVHDVINTSGGKSLDPDTRSFMEPRFGYDFSNVKIHDNPIAAKSSDSINALAYTSGNNVVFNSGQYNTNSDSGKRLLAHELTHTIQQGSVIPTMNLSAKQDQIQRQAAPAPRKTIWVNIGFDSSAQANEETMKKLRASIAVEKAAISNCCSAHANACNIDVKTNYDWVRYNKPAPADLDYDDDDAADRKLRDENLGKISGPAGGTKILVTESTLSQTWQGARIFPRANTGVNGVLWNRNLSANDTIAHESGHAAGYTGDSEGGSHSSDPNNLMSPGSIRVAGALPDENWCQQMAAIAV